MELTDVLVHPASRTADEKRQPARTRKGETEVKSGPRISIITVTYNSALTIADTLDSVRRQTYGNIEHIIIDGDSADCTMAIVRSYPHVACWVSEKDMGLYHAMNKGLQLATGDIIGILNSDDFYAHESVLQKVAEAFQNEDTDTLYGDLDYVQANDVNKIVRKWKSGSFKRRNFSLGWMPPHPTFFVKREVYHKVGGFNLNFKSAADYELMLRILFKHRFRAGYIRDVLVKMRAGGVSNGSLLKRLMANREDRLAWKINDLKPYFYTLYLKPLRKVFQFINREQLQRIPLINHMF